jgi:hypothetical protein
LFIHVFLGQTPTAKHINPVPSAGTNPPSLLDACEPWRMARVLTADLQCEAISIRRRMYQQNVLQTGDRRQGLNNASGLACLNQT